MRLSSWRHLDAATQRDIGLVCVADAIVGASFGAIVVSKGLDPWVPIVMSLVIFAAGAQFAALGVIFAGASPVAAVAAGLVLNARLLPFGFIIADVFGRRRLSRLVGPHLMMDEAVAFVLRQPDQTRRRAAFWTCAIGIFVSWNLAVVVGVIVGQGIDTEALGLDAAFPAVLLALVVPALGERSTRNAVIAGAVVAVAATPFLPAGLPILLSLVGLGAAGSAARRPMPADSREEGVR